MVGILQVKNLQVKLRETNEYILKGVDFKLKSNQILALVGESGSGKSITSQAILRLLNNKIFIIEGEVLFKGRNLLELREKEMCKLRGKEISMVYQNPFTAMNPLFSIGYQIEECIKIHKNLSKKDRKEDMLKILKMVHLTEAEKILDKYPYELSGGQLQRVIIAMGLITKPDILIADEPTTALDVTTQKEIIYLIKELSEELNMSVLLITHDLGIVAEIADWVAVMNKGKIIETSEVVDFFDFPKKDYSKKLLSARPKYL